MSLSGEQLKALALEMAAAMPPPVPVDRKECALVETYRQLGDEGRERVDRFVRRLLDREIGMSPEPMSNREHDLSRSARRAVKDFLDRVAQSR